MEDKTGKVFYENGELVFYSPKNVVLQVGELQVRRNWFRRFFNLPPKYTEISLYDNSVTK